MIWKLNELQYNQLDQKEINGKWLYARPINYKYRNLFEKLKEAYLVFIGKVEIFIFPEDEEK